MIFLKPGSVILQKYHTLYAEFLPVIRRFLYLS
jgi:hypothetical protein